MHTVLHLVSVNATLFFNEPIWIIFATQNPEEIAHKQFCFLFIYLFIKGIHIAQVRKGHKCAMLAEMAVWLRNCHL